MVFIKFKLYELASRLPLMKFESLRSKTIQWNYIVLDLHWIVLGSILVYIAFHTLRSKNISLLLYFVLHRKNFLINNLVVSTYILLLIS